MSVNQRCRGSAVALVALVVSFAWLPSATAAPALTIPLDPSLVMVYLAAVENEGRVDPADPGAVPPYTPVPVQWQGNAVVQLPAELDGTDMDVTLDLAPTDESEPTRSYSTTTPGPEELVVTPGGAPGSWSVALPAATGDGPVGWLVFDNITSTVAGDVLVLPLIYELDFTGPGAPTQPLSTQMAVMAMPDCGDPFPGECPPHVVEPGSTVAFTVPPTSLLRSLGVGTLTTLSAVLLPTDQDGVPVDEELILLEEGLAESLAASSEPLLPGGVADLAEALAVDEGAVELSAAVAATGGPHNATLNLPADLSPGQYMLSLIEGASVDDDVSVSFVNLEVPAPAAPAPPTMNTGLLSDTGWEESAEPTAGMSPLVPLGVGMMLAAGLVGAAVLRSGRRSTSAE